MKTLLLIILFTIAAQQADGQLLKKQIRRESQAVAAYTANLAQDNTGVVVSSMVQLMAWVQRHPNAKTDAVYGELAKLMHDPDMEVRERAYLTLSALADRRMLVALPAITEENAGQTFQQIAKALGFRNHIVLM